MGYEWFISLRYLKTRRRQGFISLISLISVAGVAVGVVVQAVEVLDAALAGADAREDALELLQTQRESAARAAGRVSSACSRSGAPPARRP